MNDARDPRLPALRSRRRPLLFFFLLLLVATLSLLGLRTVRSEHHKLVLLRRQIQIAAAPGERIILDDRLLVWGLSQAGSTSVHAEIALVPQETSPEQIMAGHAEIVLVVSETDRLAERLRAAGYTLMADQMSLPNDLLGRRGVQIFFVVAKP